MTLAGGLLIGWGVVAFWIGRWVGLREGFRRGAAHALRSVEEFGWMSAHTRAQLVLLERLGFRFRLRYAPDCEPAVYEPPEVKS